MNTPFHNRYLKISLKRKGHDRYVKISFPVEYGIFSEIETDEHIFQFNLNGEISRAKSKTRIWPHPAEWLKRNAGNDWIYYSTGGYTGVREAIGEYYLPNFTYQTNSLIGGNPFREKAVAETMNTWYEKLSGAVSKSRRIPGPIKVSIDRMLENSEKILAHKADRLIRAIGGRVSVLPPDARHVDYNVIPLNIQRGCLYNCSFCRVKTQKGFSLLSKQDIQKQVGQLKAIYKENIINYNAVFLGEHDALNAPVENIEFAASDAFSRFNFSRSYMKGNYLFLFGSVDSLLEKSDDDFKRLASLPFFIYINIGLESPCQKTLDAIGKPITQEKIKAGWEKINRINDTYPFIEISANFVLDEAYLPQSHIPAVTKLVNENRGTIKSKGCIYFSPLKFNSSSRQALFRFKTMKSRINSPAFLYIIQRL